MNAEAAVAPTPRPVRDVFAEAADLSNADLANRLQTMAGQITAATGAFLVYLGAFDLADGWHGEGIASCAHWLSYYCGMSKSAAGEQVRVARRLRDLPVMRQAMLEGRLSFSKARALTRVATPASEADLVQTALGCSAAQLDRLCKEVARALTDDQAQDRRNRVRFTASYDTDGMLVGSFRLAPEDGAALMAAIDARLPDRIESDADEDPSAKKPWRPRGVGEEPAPPTEGAVPDELTDFQTRLDRSRAAAFASVGRDALAHTPEDGPASTTTEVIVHVNGTQLDRLLADRATLTGTAAPTARPVPANPWQKTTGVSATAIPQTSVVSSSPSPAPSVQRWNGDLLTPSTKHLLDGALDTCADADGRPLPLQPLPGEAVGWVEGGPGLALATVERLLCDGSIRTRCGHEHPDAPDPRARRQPSRKQRRELWRRDKGCRAPGCQRRRNLHAHHIIPWWLGGPTTLANMVLLCEQHHHLVHEGGWALTVKDHLVVLTSSDSKRTFVEAPRTYGTVDDLVDSVPATIGALTQIGQQSGDPMDLGYATTVVATNIQLAERQAAEQQAAT